MKYLILALAFVFVPVAASADLSPAQEAVFEKMIRRYVCSGGNLTPLISRWTSAQQETLYNAGRTRILNRNQSKRDSADSDDAEFPGN